MMELFEELKQLELHARTADDCCDNALAASEMNGDLHPDHVKRIQAATKKVILWLERLQDKIATGEWSS